MRLALIVCAMFVSLLPGVSAAPSGPVLEVTASSPFTVRGVRFVAGEQVTVIAQVEGRHVKLVTASKTGAFTVRFAGVALGSCPAYIVRATGNRGSQAYLRSLPECMPPNQEP